MPPVLDIALAASARSWPDRVHRHVLDHGGARVVGRLLGAIQCVDADYDVLFIDDVCSYLSPRLVALLRQRGRVVIGVYDGHDSPDAKRRLLECGISDVIESDAEPEEFVARAMAAAEIESPTVATRVPRSRRGAVVGVMGVTDGVGATEVAVGMAWRLATRVSAVLVDIDPGWPSVAQRLALPPHPNLRTLVDVVVHEGELGSAFAVLGGLKVVGGAPWRGSQGALPQHEVTMALHAVREDCDVVISDLGAAERVDADTLYGLDALVVVALGDPVGTTRLIRAAKRWGKLSERVAPVAMVNMCSRRRFHRAEVRRELSAALPDMPVVLSPLDSAVAEAAWEGKPVKRGRFAREVARMADLVAGTVGR